MTSLAFMARPASRWSKPLAPVRCRPQIHGHRCVRRDGGATFIATIFIPMFFSWFAGRKTKPAPTKPPKPQQQRGEGLMFRPMNSRPSRREKPPSPSWPHLASPAAPSARTTSAQRRI